MSVQYFEGIGRRKQSIARVRLMNGSGRFIVNDKEAPAYFTRLGDLDTILALVSPSLGGICSVPIAIFVIFRFFRKRFLVISAASTAVVIACPLAFKVISYPLP